MEKNTKDQSSGKQAGIEFHLTGRITDHDTKQGLPDLRVTAVDKDPNYDQTLGSAITGENGHYVITFSSSQIGKGEHGGPYIVISAFNEEGMELGKSPMYRNAPAKLTIDLEVDLPIVPKPTAYEELLGKIAPLLGLKLLRKLDETEIAAMAEKAGIPAKLLANLVASAQLAYRTNLPQELFFGLMENTAVADLDGLFAHSPDQLRDILTASVKEHKVDQSVMSRLAELEALRPAHESIANFTTRLGIEVSSSVLEVLENKNIRTLSDISKAGGLKKIEGLPTENNEVVLTLLDAHADLSRVVPDATVNAQMIDHGFNSVSVIAFLQPYEFVGALGGVLGLKDARQFYEKFAAREMTLRNAMAGTLALWANRYEYRTEVPWGEEISTPPEKCRCDDCAAAVSPLAYLADLMDYSRRHLRNDVSTLVILYADDATMYALRIANAPTNNSGNSGGGGSVSQKPDTPIINLLNGSISTYVVDISFTFPRQGIRGTVFYTTDGSNPVPGPGGSPEYNEITPVKLINSAPTPLHVTVKALAANESTPDWLKSAVVSRSFTLAPMAQAAAPAIAPSGETALFAPATVFITCDDPNVTARYTIDGGVPDNNSTPFSWDSPIVFQTPGRHTIKAIGFHLDFPPSDLVTATIIVESPPLTLLAPQNGLTAEYYQDSDLTDLKVLTRDTYLQFDWKDKSPDPRFDPDTFSARWTGWITPRFNEEYTFHIISDDGVRLWVDGQLIIDHWSLQSPNEIHSSPIRLTAGRRYPIKLEYFENQGRAVAMLLWSSQSQRKEVIPPGTLRPSTIDIAFLEDNFYQPFTRLPASCAVMDEQVRQVRIAIEVLRAYLGSNNTADEAPYRLAAYRAIVGQLGTSFEELRLTRNAPSEQRQLLADRIGIPVTDLDGLLLDPATSLTEANLETVFGLRDTHRDPLANQSEPKIRTWRRKQLRNMWQSQDIVVDPFEAAFQPAAARLPFIDPDVIGPDDFRQPEPSNPAFSVWIARRSWVDVQLLEFDARRLHATVPKIDNLFSMMYDPVTYAATVTATVTAWVTPPVTAFTRLFDALTGGTASEVKAAADEVAGNLRISVDAFLKLMAVHAEELQGVPVTEEEWQDVYSILVSARKAALADTWRQEEAAAVIEFGPKDFWASITEPKQGQWPPGKAEAGFYTDPSKIPYIDPDLVKESNLPDPTAGKQAREIWQTRQATLRTIHDALKLARQRSFADMLKQAWGEPNPGDAIPASLNLDQLLTDLQGTNAAAAANATTSINRDLHLSSESFTRLMAILAKDTQTDLQKKPTAAEYAEAEVILLQAFKFKRKYPAWAFDERNDPDWQFLKIRLPRWRAGVENRQRWQQALLLCCSAPLIDPDLISLAEIKTPESHHDAYDLWKQRYDWIGQQLSLLKGTPRTVNGLNSIVHQEIGIDPADCWNLVTLRDAGQNIAPRLAQWNLSNGAYNRLVRIHDLAINNATILEDEWNEVFSIMFQANKVREFASWRRLEASHSLTLSQDHFVQPEANSSSYGDGWQPVQWRSTWRDRQDWLDRLQARIDQEATVNEAVKSAIGAVEASTLPLLRDALIANSAAKGSTVSAKADALAHRLLIDMKAGGCQMTSRVAQAIETLQSLIWEVRTGQWQDSILKLALLAPNFDEEWKWIGSYAMWRAAMFVFIYPENLLLPTLRKSCTPGFTTLVGNLRSTNRVTPKIANAFAKQYSDYFQDICSLQPVVSIEVLRRINNDGSSEQVDQTTAFYFGIASKRRKVYWSYRNAVSGSHSNSQSYWDELNALAGIEEIIGAVCYQTPIGERRLYVFALLSKEGKQQLVFITFDLLTDKGWDLEPKTIDYPNGVIRGRVRLFKSSGTSSVPKVALWADNGGQYSASLNVLGDGVESGGFQPSTQQKSFGNWQDIPASELNFPNAKVLNDYHDHPKAVANLIARMNEYACRSGFAAAIPTFFYSDNNTGQHYGAYMLTADAVESRDVPAQDLGNPKSQSDPDFNAFEIATRFAAVSVYAQQQGFDGGFPNFFETNGNTVYGVQLLKTIASPPATIETSAVKLTTRLSQNDLPKVKTVSQNGADFNADDVVLRFRKFNDYLNAQNPSPALGGFPTFVDDSDPNPFQVAEFNDSFSMNLVLGPWQAKLLSAINNIKPDFQGPFDISSYSLGEQLLRRSNRSANAFLAIENASSSNLVYFAEAWYFIPILLAQKLQENGFYTEALDWYRTVYDYGTDAGSRLIYYGLELDENRSSNSERIQDWLGDPLNPHLLAENRQYAYTRYTLFSIIRCLLDYADAEYTRDTAESVPRARQLYETALDLLETTELKQSTPCCVDPVDALDTDVRNALVGSDLVLLPFWARIRDKLLQWNDCPSLTPTLAGVRGALFPAAGSPAWLDRLVQAWTVVESVPRGSAAIPPIADAFSNNVPAWWRTLEDSSDVDAVIIGLVGTPSGHVPALNWLFCVPENPVRKSMQLHAEINLYKMRHCRNIAGMERVLDIYAAATDTMTGMPVIGAAGQIVLPGTAMLRPTPYRYVALIERAKQLAQLAAQMEASMFSALEKRDTETYGLLRARQDLQLARSNVRLQDLKIKEASDGTTLAEMQRDRALIQFDQYQDWIDKGWNDWELTAIVSMWGAFGAYSAVVGFTVAASVGELDNAKSWASILSATGQAAQTFAQLAQQYAALERRKNDWQFSLNLARQDTAIGNQQISISKDREKITAQEKVIAELNRSNDETVVDFLTNKFTNVELYEWMSNVLARVYAFFLQQATSTAKLAEGQLTFERHEPAPGYILDDYWDAPNDQPTIVGGAAPDRRGLTGSARLLQDIYQLDLYASDRNKRKLDLTETISLARMAPVEFQQFRETGVITFRTPMELFDRKFPGHYLRLIKRIRTSVVALIPPSLGIHASLSSGGLSRVVIGGDIYQTEVIRRAPESVALTSPMNATGVFDLDPNPDMLLPFEAMGVDTTWEFRLPKPANPFDYASIADILVTLEYTALDSYDYRQQVLQLLPERQSGDMPFSFHYDFTDAWYDLHNPAQSSTTTSTTMTVSVQTRHEDFPANLDRDSLKIQQVALYFARVDGAAFEVPVTDLQYTPEKMSGSVGGGTTTIDGVISTRRGNAGSWTSMIGKSPVGVWQLTLPKEVVRSWFAEDQIQDILLVITYAGLSPSWPK